MVHRSHADARPDPPAAAVQRQLSEDDSQQGGLPGAIRPEDGNPFSRSDLQVDRAEGERSAANDCLLQSQRYIAAVMGGSEFHPQLPALPRFLHRVESLYGALGRLRLRCLLLAARHLEASNVLVVLSPALDLRSALHGPRPLFTGAVGQHVAFGHILLVLFHRVASSEVTSGDVLGPAAGELDALM